MAGSAYSALEKPKWPDATADTSYTNSDWAEYSELPPRKRLSKENLKYRAKRSWKFLSRQSWRTMRGEIWPTVRYRMWPTWRKRTWNFVRHRRLHLHLMAIALFLLFGIAPIAFFFRFARGPFSQKTIHCSTGGDQALNGSTIQGLFTIDRTFGTMPFWSAKFVDVAWDLLIGRGFQMLSGFISYVVFTSALLHALERSPAPYQTFLDISLNGSSMATAVTLLSSLGQHRSKRSRALFFYIILSCCYLLALPTLLGAMTGYINSSTAYVNLNLTSEDQLVKYDDLLPGFVVEDGWRINMPNDSCIPAYTADGTSYEGAVDIFSYWSLATSRLQYCPCNLSSVETLYPDGRHVLSNGTSLYPHGSVPSVPSSCNYNISDYEFSYYNGADYDSSPCNASLWITVHGKKIVLGNETLKVNFTDYSETGGFARGLPYACYSNETIPWSAVNDAITCLPSAGMPLYQWGFSTMLSAVVVILQCVWAVTMYVIWIDAEINSPLVRSGYRMTQIRAAFALSARAQDTLDAPLDELIAVPVDKVTKSLFQKGSTVDIELFTKDSTPAKNSAREEEETR